MKVKPGFILREICGEKVIAADASGQIDFGKLICLNESAVYLWESVQGKSFSVDFLAGLLCERYDVSMETALRDSEAFCNKLQGVGVIE